MENKIFFQGVMLLITSLFGIISGLGVYVWNSQRNEYDRKIRDLKKDVDELYDNLHVALTDIKKNCQAVSDLKESCKERHYGKIHDFNR